MSFAITDIQQESRWIMEGLTTMKKPPSPPFIMLQHWTAVAQSFQPGRLVFHRLSPLPNDWRDVRASISRARPFMTRTSVTHVTHQVSTSMFRSRRRRSFAAMRKRQTETEIGPRLVLGVLLAYLGLGTLPFCSGRGPFLSVSLMTRFNPRTKDYKRRTK
jgi:hypothetical protein